MLNLPFLLKNDEITLSYPAVEVKKRFFVGIDALPGMR